MKNENNQISRRRFSLGLAIAPLALTIAPQIGAQEAAKKLDAAAPATPLPPQPEPKKRWQIYEEEYFTHPLV